jgi:hypothetical protein
MQVPLEELGRHEGWQVTFADAGDRHGPPSITAPMVRGYDVIVAQRWNTHKGLPVWRGARTPFSRLVYDLDDDLWSVAPDNFKAHHLYNDPVVQDAVEEHIRIADLVTVSTEPLAQVVRRFNPAVAVLANCIPGWVLDLPPGPQRDRPRIGWMGAGSHGADISEVIAAPVRRFLRRHEGWDFQCNATDYRPTITGTSPAARRELRPRLFFSPWIQVNDDPRGFYSAIDFDVGLCPLWPTTFSRSKCIDSSMRISTDQGVIEAGSIQPGMKVWLGGWREVQAVEHQPPQLGRRITTRRGLRVTVTLDHRLMGDHGWRESQDLRVGDELKLVQEQCPELPYQRVPWPADGRVTRAGAPDPMAFLQAAEGPSVAITETWGRILGLFTGDGSFGGKTAIRFSCDGQDADLIKMLMADLEVAGFRATTDSVTTWGGEVLRRRTVNTASAHLCRFLAALGAGRPHSETGQRWERTLRVPDAIFRSPESVRAAFLAGLFEADGCATRSAVSLTTRSEDLARDVQRLLWSIGIPSGLHRHRGSQRSPYADRIYWAVQLRLEETKLYALRVGFLSERKQGRLDEIIRRDAERREQNKNGDRRGTTLNGLLPIRWADQIESIEPVTVSPVDIQVEGEAYSATGIYSHNSAIKAIEMSARGIPVIASDCEAYRPVIEHGVNGFLAKQDHEWLKYMSELTDDGLRAKMGQAAREMAARHTIGEHWVKWAAAYEALFPARQRGAYS